MSRVLIAWELGGNYGHVARCLPIAGTLRQRGHTVMLALQNLRTAAETLSASGLRYCQAPMPSRRSELARPPVNYAEILLGEGYGDRMGLLGMTRAWQSLLELHDSALLLADHAPTALLAAQLRGIPHLAIGNGFAIPPDASPLPSIRPWEAIAEDRLARADRRLQKRLNQVAAATGYAHPIGLSDLFGCNSLLDTFPELDHYGVRPNGRYIGPIFGFSDGLPLAWQHPDTAKVLVYVHPGAPGFSALMAALGKIDAEKICFIPGLRPADAQRYANLQTRIALKPVALGPLLNDADLMIAQGGGGTINEALLAGVPLLLISSQVEQYLGALCVERIGAGLNIGIDRSEAAFRVAIGDLLRDPGWRTHALYFAKRHQGFKPEQSVAAAVEAIEASMSRNGNVSTSLTVDLEMDSP